MPVRWQCPVSMQSRRYTSKSDVYSLGIVLWEIFSHGRLPHGDVPTSALLSTVASGAQLRRPFPSTPDRAHQLILQCTALQLASRPTAAQVADLLGPLAAGADSGGAAPAQQEQEQGSAGDGPALQPRSLHVEGPAALKLQLGGGGASGGGGSEGLLDDNEDDVETTL